MNPALRVISIAMLLALAGPVPSFADTAAECRKMAAEEEVPAEDLEDYLAECLAVEDSEAPDEGAPAGDEQSRGQ